MSEQETHCPNCDEELLVDPDDSDIRLCPDCDTVGDKAWAERFEDIEYQVHRP